MFSPTYLPAGLSACLPACMHACMHALTQVHAQAQAYTGIPACTHTCSHKQMLEIHAYTQMCKCCRAGTWMDTDRHTRIRMNTSMSTRFPIDAWYRDHLVFTGWRDGNVLPRARPGISQAALNIGINIRRNFIIYHIKVRVKLMIKHSMLQEVGTKASRETGVWSFVNLSVSQLVS